MFIGLRKGWTLTIKGSRFGGKAILEIPERSQIDLASVCSVQQTLRHHLLDDERTLPHRQARDLAANLILYIPDGLEAIWKIALEWLGRELDAERVDAGYLRAHSNNYQPGQLEWMKETGKVPSISGISVRLDDPYVTYLLGMTHAITCDDLRTDGVMRRSLREDLLSHGARSKMGIFVRSQAGRSGFLCVDRITKRQRHWSTNQYELFDTIGRIVLPRILDATFFTMCKPDISLERFSEKFQLSLAETSVAALLYKGQSYKQIAAALGKSPHTVDHQVRSIRKKLKPFSSVAFELRRLCGNRTS